MYVYLYVRVYAIDLPNYVLVSPWGAYDFDHIIVFSNPSHVHACLCPISDFVRARLCMPNGGLGVPLCF